MKRDWDLVRKILQTIEEGEHGNATNPFFIPGYPHDVVGYHVHLMGEGGLLHAVDTGHMGSKSPCAYPLSLTWNGHEFLDAARKDTTWNRATERAKRVGAATFPMIQSLLMDGAKELLFPK